jgi:predicted transcriptional regulator
MQTRYQLVQTYFINISTTNHRARAVRIHPSRAVFRKDEKFSEPLYILGGNPKKSSSNARKQKAKERGISRSIHARAIQTMLYHLSLSLSLSLSLEKLIIIADDNKRECSTLTFAILFLCL